MLCQLQVQGASTEDSAQLPQLSQLPQLLHLSVSCDVAEGVLPELSALPGLAVLTLFSNEAVTLMQLQVALPLLRQVTRLDLSPIALSPEICSFLAQLTQLRHLSLQTDEDPQQGHPSGIHLLSRLQQLTALYAGECVLESAALGVLEISGLQVLTLDHVPVITAGWRPLAPCNVTHLQVGLLTPWDADDAAPTVPLPRLARLTCSIRKNLDFEIVVRYTALTNLQLLLLHLVTRLQALSRLPLLCRLCLKCGWLGRGLSDKVLVSGLQGCDGLVHLTLRDLNTCGISDKGLLQLAAALPSLRSLAVSKPCGVTTPEGRWEACNTVALRSGAPFAWQPGQLEIRELLAP